MLRRIFDTLGLIIMLIVGTLMFMASCTGFWVGHAVAAEMPNVEAIQAETLVFGNEHPLPL